MTYSREKEIEAVTPKYSKHIMKAVRQTLDLDEDDTSMDSVINDMSGEEIVDHFLHWNGIFGYTSTIIDVVSQAIFEVYED